MADYARSVNILVEIAGNPEAKLDAVNRKLDNLSNKKVTVGSSASGATDAVSRLSSTTDKASESFTSLGSKITSAFGNVKSSLNDVKSSMYYYTFDDERLVKNTPHKLVVTTTDNTGNRTEYRYEFVY